MNYHFLLGGGLQQYSVNQQLIETVLASMQSGEIAIPEIQRPFVWNATKVRDRRRFAVLKFSGGLPCRWTQSEYPALGGEHVGRQEDSDRRATAGHGPARVQVSLKQQRLLGYLRDCILFQ
jgi:hypothetical protein